MRRVGIVMAGICFVHTVIATPVWGQTPPNWPTYVVPSVPPPRDPPPHFSITPLHGRSADGLPLPPIGLQLPSIGLQPRDLKPAGNPPRSSFHRRRGPRSNVIVWPVFVPAYGDQVEAAPSASPRGALAPTPPPVPSSTGRLVLNVEPGDAQVFVDGYYVGTIDDLTLHRDGLEIDAGPHRIDLKAPDRVASSIDVRITAGQSLTYTQALAVTPGAAAPAPQVNDRPATFYLIPGCYMGNVHPRDADLPSTCDLSKVVTVTH